jgi:hypothetical protein
MVQEEVIDFLKKQPEPLTSGEIAEGMCESKTKISRALSILLKFDEICCKEIDRIEAYNRCKCKRRCRIYYINS